MVARDPSCADDYDDASLSCEDALARILAQVEAVAGYERLALRTALGRVLGEAIQSPVDVPQHTNSAMDGYALRADDLPTAGDRRLRIAGTAFAGKPFAGTLEAGAAVRIMTGAALPAGSDTVVMQEHAVVAGDFITIDASHQRGQHVRVAGEDLQRGQLVFARGHRLDPPDLGLVAALGVGEVAVYRRVRVAYFSTGDELRSIGETLAVGDIYDSNRYTLYAMLKRLDVDIVDMGVVRDRREAIERALREAAAMADVVITSGGVSIGEADYIKEVLAGIGEVRFWKVALKPGRPLAFGTLGKASFFGLPGNPVSVMVTFYQFVQPALIKMAGGAPAAPILLKARTTATLNKRPGRKEFQRGVLSRGDDGEMLVSPTGAQGSGILHSMSHADCFIVLPLASGNVECGSVVEVQPFHGFM